MGHPCTGITPMVGLRLHPEVRRRVEAWVKENELSFSDAVRQLLEIGLELANTQTKE
jgi:hypothetical protein